MPSNTTNAPTLIQFAPAASIPDYLTGEVQSKLAYVDERIVRARVSTDRIEIEVAPWDESQSSLELEKKVQHVVLSMARGAYKPKVQVLDDFLDRPTTFRDDPMVELLRRGEVNQEADGIYALGPLLTRLVGFFENQFVALAESFGAAPYRFPTLIPARYLERVNYFRAFPHSLTFVTHLREDLDVIDEFSQHAACGHQGLTAPPDSFASIQALLSPAVCYHLYFALADKPCRADRQWRRRWAIAFAMKPST